MSDFHKIKDLDNYKKSGLDLINIWKEFISKECSIQSVDFSVVEEDANYLKVFNTLAGISQHRINTHQTFMQNYIELSHPQKGLFARLGIERRKMYQMPTRIEQTVQDLNVKVADWEESVLNLMLIDEDIIRTMMKVTAHHVIKEISKKKIVITERSTSEILENKNKDPFEITMQELDGELRLYLKNKKMSLRHFYSLNRNEFLATWSQFKQELFAKEGFVNEQKWDEFKSISANNWNAFKKGKLKIEETPEPVEQKPAKNDEEIKIEDIMGDNKNESIS